MIDQWELNAINFWVGQMSTSIKPSNKHDNFN